MEDQGTTHCTAVRTTKINAALSTPYVAARPSVSFISLNLLLDYILVHCSLSAEHLRVWPFYRY